MSSPPSLHSPELFLQDSKVKPRSQTEALLPPSFDPSLQETLSTPVPEKDRKAYTVSRFQKSLEYCQGFLARPNISPRSETFMMLFQDELKVAIQAENEDDKLAGAGTIRVFEHLIQRNAFLKAEVFTKSQEMQQNLLELRELQYDSRYGDYVKIVPARIRIHASETKIENWQLLCGRFQWLEISKRLSREQALSYDGYKRQEGPRSKESAAMEPLDLDTRVSVAMACRDLGISEELAVWSIIEYGERNRTFHRDLDSLKADGDFRQLALVLYTDLEDIDCVFSELRSETDKHALKSFICDEIDKWFDNSFDPEDVNKWIAKPELIAAYKEAKATRDTSTKAEKKATNISENQRRSEEKAAELKDSYSGSSTLASNKIRASTEEPRGSEDESAKRSAERRKQLLVQICQIERELKCLRKEIDQLDNP